MSRCCSTYNIPRMAYWRTHLTLEPLNIWAGESQGLSGPESRKAPKDLRIGKQLSLSICSALGVGGDNRQHVPCNSSGCSGSEPGVRRNKCVEFSQAQVRSLGNLGSGMPGSVCVSNGVKSPDSSLAATISESSK